MTLHILDDLIQGTPEWHDQRRGMVTASAVGKLLTPTLKVADNDVSRGLVAQLTAERITGTTDPTFVNDDMMRGILHEGLARDRYAEHHNVTVTQVGFAVRDDWGFQLGASPDGLVGDDGGLEVKCPRAKTHIRTIAADRVPQQYVAQVQACMLVLGRQWWDFASFCAGLPLWTKRVYADPDWHAAIVEAVAEFEKSSEKLTSDYLTRAEGLPATEYIADDLELVI